MVELAAPELPAISGAVKGTVAIAPTALGKPFQVVVPTFSADHAYEIRRWQSRGLTVPAVGDEVLIVEDEIGLPWVIAWWPAAGDVVGYRNYGIVEALPTGTIAKGSRCTFKAATGIYWDLLYTEEATYPWAVIGGPPLENESTSALETASGTPAVRGELTAPLAMVADIYVATRVVTQVGATAAGPAIQALNNAIAVGPVIVSVLNGASLGGPLSGVAQAQAIVKNKVVACGEYTTSGTVKFFTGSVQLMPRRVG